MQQFQDEIMKNKELCLDIFSKLLQRIDEVEKRMADLENTVKKSH